MNLKKRIIALIALVALISTSLILPGQSALADDIDTTITVLETACTDDPSTVSMAIAANPNWYMGGNQNHPNDWTWDPATATSGAWIGTNGATEGVRVNMDINECLTGWTLDAAVTDFTSIEGNTIASTNRFYLVISTFNGRAMKTSDTQACVSGTCWYPIVEFAGTYSVLGPVTGSGAYGEHVYFGGTGPDYTPVGYGYPLMTGDETATGVMYGTYGMRWGNMDQITNTPAGNYTGTLKFTFTPTGP